MSDIENKIKHNENTINNIQTKGPQKIATTKFFILNPG